MFFKVSRPFFAVIWGVFMLLSNLAKAELGKCSDKQCSKAVEVMKYGQSKLCHLEAIAEIGNPLSPDSEKINTGTMMNIYYRSSSRAIVTYKDNSGTEKLAAVKASCLKPDRRIVFNPTDVDFEKAKELVLKQFVKEVKPTESLETEEAVNENIEQKVVNGTVDHHSASLTPTEAGSKTGIETTVDVVPEEPRKVVESPGEAPETADVPQTKVPEKSVNIVEQGTPKETIPEKQEVPTETIEAQKEKDELKVSANVEEIAKPTTEEIGNKTDDIVLLKEEGKLTIETIEEGIQGSGGSFFLTGAKAEEPDAASNSQTKSSAVDENEETLTDSNGNEHSGSSNKSSRRSSSNFPNGVQALEQNEEIERKEAISESNETGSTEDLEKTIDDFIAASYTEDTQAEANATEDENVSEDGGDGEIAASSQLDDFEATEKPPNTLRPKIEDTVGSWKDDPDVTRNEFVPEPAQPNVISNFHVHKSSEEYEDEEIRVDTGSQKQNNKSIQPNVPRVKDTEPKISSKFVGTQTSTKRGRDINSESGKGDESGNLGGSQQSFENENAMMDETEMHEHYAQNGGKPLQHDNIHADHIHKHAGHKHDRHHEHTSYDHRHGDHKHHGLHEHASHNHRHGDHKHDGLHQHASHDHGHGDHKHDGHHEHASHDHGHGDHKHDGLHEHASHNHRHGDHKHDGHHEHGSHDHGHGDHKHDGLHEHASHDHGHGDHEHAIHDHGLGDHKHDGLHEHASHDHGHGDHKHDGLHEHASHDHGHGDHKHDGLHEHASHDHGHGDHGHASHDHRHGDHKHDDLHEHASHDHEHTDYKHDGHHEHGHVDQKPDDHRKQTSQDHKRDQEHGEDHHHDHRHHGHDLSQDHKHNNDAHVNHEVASINHDEQHGHLDHRKENLSHDDQQYHESEESECCKSVPRYLRHVLPTMVAGHELVSVHLVNLDKLLSAFDKNQASQICKMHWIFKFLCEEKLFQLPLWFWIGLYFVFAMPYFFLKLIASLFKEDSPLAVNVKDIERRQVYLLQQNRKLEAVIQSFDDEKNKFAEEHGKLYEALQKVTNEKIMLERTHEKLQAHLDESENVCEDLKASKRELTSLLRHKEVELGELRQHCEAEMSKQKSAEENLIHMHGKLANTSATCESLQRQIDLLQNQLDTQVLESTTQKQRARELEQNIDTLNHLKNGLEQDLVDLEKTVAAKEDAVKTLKHDMEIFKKTFVSAEVKSFAATSSKATEMKKEKSSSLSDGWDADFDEDVDEELLNFSEDRTTQFESIFDAAKLKYELDKLKVLYDDTMNQLKDQSAKLKSCEAQTESAERKREFAERALNKGQIKFQFIEAYLKTTVSDLQKQVAELEHKTLNLDKMLTEAKSGQHSAVGDCERYRLQVDDLTDELKRTDEKNKKEISKLQNTAHTAYMEARKLEDKYQSLKHEYDKLRLKKFPKKEPSVVHEEPSKLSKASQEEKPRKTSRRQRSNRSMSPLDDDWSLFGLPPPPPPMPPFMMGMPPPSMGAAHPPPLGAHHGVTGHHDAFVPLNNNPHLYADPFMSPNYNNSGQYQHESDNTGTDHTGEPNTEERSRQEVHDRFYNQHRGNGNHQYMQCVSADSSQYPMPSGNTNSQFYSSATHNKSS